MGSHHEKPGSPGDVLKHYGVKGMKWGIRRDREAGGGWGGAKPLSPANPKQHNADTKMYMAARGKGSKLSEAQAKAIFAENQKKAAAKLEPSESGGKNLLTAKNVAIGVGAAYGAYSLYKGVKLFKDYNDLLKNLPGTDIDLEKLGITDLKDIDRLAGKPIDPDNFNGLVWLSKGKTWFSDDPGYLTDEAFARPEFELPAGHTFHRLATKVESGFRPASYVTHSVDDFNRYVAGFRHEKFGADFHHVTFQSKAPVRVPNLTTVLGHLSETMKEQGHDVSPSNVMRHYNDLSGGGWSTATAKGLIKRLKDSGYGAIVDEMDAGVIGETPLVFFGVDNAGPKKSISLDNEAIQRAEQMLKEIGKPPGRKH